jgi:hypothetical protein
MGTENKKQTLTTERNCVTSVISIQRKRIETAFSDIAKYLPKKIHAVTETGFLIKLIMFIWAYTFDKLYKL